MSNIYRVTEAERLILLKTLTDPYTNSEESYVDDKARNLINNLVPYLEALYLKGYSNGIHDAPLKRDITVLTNGLDNK